MVDVDGHHAEYITHAVWCDNVIVFATDRIMLQTMLEEIASAIEKFEFVWKPHSLEVLPVGSLSIDFVYVFCVTQRGESLGYKTVHEIVLLGEKSDRDGSTTVSTDFRMA